MAVTSDVRPKSYCMIRSDKHKMSSRIERGEEYSTCQKAQFKSRPRILVILDEQQEQEPLGSNQRTARFDECHQTGATCSGLKNDRNMEKITPNRPNKECAINPMNNLTNQPDHNHHQQEPDSSISRQTSHYQPRKLARDRRPSIGAARCEQSQSGGWTCHGSKLLLAAVCLVLQLACWLAAPSAAQQYKPEWPQKIIEQEIFLLNLQDGYFGCQVNTSQDFLQLFELSRLCDGQPQCYLGSDELAGQLKCRDRDHCETYNSTSGQQERVRCVNGVCLDGLCYCNDGYGGKSCDIADENECKFRPCDVFAHCTNTLGSYYCSCFPDINECEIPSLEALCSDNSECVNLPGHFVCKCKPGYHQSGVSQSTLAGAPGNATVQCTDIDECSAPGSCGKGALCENFPGSFRCACPPGFGGDPLVECTDMDECRNNPCGIGAQCTNIPGGYKCSCAPGHEHNPNAAGLPFGIVQFNEISQEQLAELTNSSLIACLDVNECLVQQPNGKSVCGLGAQCVNTQGGYFCQCPPGFSGNPKVACVDIDECAAHACGPNAQCKNLPGSYQCECKPGYTGNAYKSDGCQDDDECLRKDACGLNAQCFNTLGSYQCTCLSGFLGDPRKSCADINECAEPTSPCGPGAQCQNLEGGYKCTCPEKYLARGTPEMGCERAAVNIGCGGDFDCTDNAQCVNSTCQCKLGYQISGIDCVDVDECSAAGPQQPLAAPVKAFTRLSALMVQQQTNNASQSSGMCGAEATCQNVAGSYRCECRSGYEKLDPSDPTSKCRDINECEAAGPGRGPCGANSKCFNTEGAYKCACNDGFIPIDGDSTNGCKSPCEGVDCGQHATCKPHGEEAACVCKPGFTFNPNNIKLGCVDINECDTNYGPSGLCGQRAVCTNVPGSYRCHCPNGYAGDAYRYCEDINECDRKFGVFGQCGELALCTNKPGSFSCACAPGYTGDPKTKCADIDECSGKFGPSGKCGLNAVCANTPGKYSCSCRPGYRGDPSVECTLEQPACSSAADCAAKNEVCQSGRCACPFPVANTPTDGRLQDLALSGPSLECKHPCDRTECGAHATCQLDSDNQPLCVCDAGYMAPSDGRSGCVDVNECIQGATLSGITPVSALSSNLGSIALGPSTATPANGTAGGHPCGRNALCRNQPGSFDCICPAGYTGDAYVACNLDVRSQTMISTTSTISASHSQQQQQQQQQHQATTSSLDDSTQQSGNTGSLFGNHQQEPRTTACSEPCPRGHVCADGKCVKRDSCRDDQDCRSSQACEQVNQALGFQCVNVCDSLMNACGPGARCTPHNHKPICACNSTGGLAGNPYDLVNGCRPLASYEQTPAQTTASGPLTSSFTSDQNFSTSTSTSSTTTTTTTTTKQQQQLTEDAQLATTASQQQQGDISTVLFGYETPAHHHTTQQVPIGSTRLTTITTNLSTSAMDQFQRQQVLDQQQQFSSTGRQPNQPLVAYDFPLPTTPISPQIDSTPTVFNMPSKTTTTNSQQTTMGSEQHHQQRNLTNQQQQQQLLQQFDITTTTASYPRQQQTATTIGSGQGLFTTKRKQQQQHHDSDNQQRHDMQTTKLGPLKSASPDQAEHRTQTAAMSEDEIASSFDQFQNKSGLIKTSYQFVYKQVPCTSDQHCPGNLFCLSSTGDSTSLGALGYEPASHQKTCACPADYRREGDFCLMHRVNCTTTSMCKLREECVSSAIIRQQQPATISQQFALSANDEFAGASTTISSGICICPRGYKLTSSGSACIDRNECDEGAPCALGAICQNKVGSYECVCPPGTVGEPYTKTCEPVTADDCQFNLNCPNDMECDLTTRRCVSPCHVCGPRAICTAANHAAICLCPPRYTGNAIDQIYGCQEPPTTTTGTANTMTTTPLPPRLSLITTTTTTTTTPGPLTTRTPANTTSAIGAPVTTLLPAIGGLGTTTATPQESTTAVDQPEYRTIPPTELFVMCLADGIHVDLQLEKFDGIIYVKGHSQDPKCRKLVMSNGSPNQMVDFKVQFGQCDLVHRDGEAGFVLVIQKHPKLVTYRARAYHVKCVYNTGERTVTLGFNVSMITTSGTIANTGPPPTCLMSITAIDGREVTSAEIGQDLLLRVDVQPDSIYGGFARSCEAKTMDDEGEYQYEVTDANGCATDPSIFSDWKYDQQRKSLVARFNAFKFPSSNNLRFQCNIRVCFGSCPAVNCNGVDAYGKRRRRRDVFALPGSNSTLAEDEAGNPEELVVADTYKEGALREEIMVQSNAILTFDKKEASLPQQQQRPPVEDIEFVCLPRLGIVMSIALTTLLALLALAVASSCWCFAKKKRQTGTSKGLSRGPAPLPHPIDFPNPLMRSASSSMCTLRESIYGP